MRRFVGVAIVLALAASAQAGVITTFEKTGASPVTIGGVQYNVWEMYADVSTDWTNARLDLVLTSGSIYQTSDDPSTGFGSDNPPLPVLVMLNPDLAYDSWLASPGPQTATIVEDGHYMGQNTDAIHASWFDTRDDAPGKYKVAQITLSLDAVGTLTGKSYDRDTQGVGVPFSAPIEAGNIIPEPATLALLAIGGLAAVIRRRR